MARRSKGKKPILVRSQLAREALLAMRNMDTADGRPDAAFGQAVFRLGIQLGSVAIDLTAMPRLPVTIRTPLDVKRDLTTILPVRILAVSIERAGRKLREAVEFLLPHVQTGSIELAREETPPWKPIEGTHHLPENLQNIAVVFLCDVMLATGGSASEAITILKARSAKKIVLVACIAAREGVRKVQNDHPDVQIVVAAIDPKLNQRAYIVPGCGDAGDRIYGKKPARTQELPPAADPNEGQVVHAGMSAQGESWVP